MSKLLCIYHGGCDDGFAAAWVVRQAVGIPDVEFYPGVYQRDPPSHDGRDVLFVDFSYKRPVLDAMATRANSILILDHVSAIARLYGGGGHRNAAGFSTPTPVHK